VPHLPREQAQLQHASYTVDKSSFIIIIIIIITITITITTTTTTCHARHPDLTILLT
jgi:hypothetical protein